MFDNGIGLQVGGCVSMLLSGIICFGPGYSEISNIIQGRRLVFWFGFIVCIVGIVIELNI